MVISVEAVSVDNAIVVDYLTSKVALEEREIGSTDPNIPTDNDCTNDEPHFSMPEGSGNDGHEGDQTEECDAIHTASR